MRILDRVTLCCIDTAHHELALAALHQCAEKCRFARVLFISDRDYALEGVDCARIATIDSREAYSRFVIKDLWRYIETEFVLLVQWDGFVVNADAWSDEFLGYDYIGAKWTFHHDGHTVGNGGFSLRSKHLLDALRDPRIEVEPLEDVAICRTHRPYLETTHAIRFAPEAIADRFSFEASYFQSLPFGFHGLFNFWMFLPKEGLARFLAMATPSILGSVQCLRLAKNYADLGRREEAAMVLRAIVAAHPGAGEAISLLAHVEVGIGTRPDAAVGRTAPCPCGSGRRYKDCHGRIDATKP